VTCLCGAPTRDDAYVCDNDLGHLARALGEVPWLDEQLTITMSRESGVDYATMGGSPSSETPLSVNAGALEAHINLRAVLVTWVRFCEEESIRHQARTDALPANTLPAISRWLLWRVDGLAFSDLGFDAYSEITRAVGRARMTIDRPAEKVYAGPCECGRDLYAKPGAKLTKCRGCEREYDVDEMREWMRSGVMGRLVTAREGATLLGRFALPTAQKTIDSWHQRRQLLDHGSNADGRRLYLIDDLLNLAARHAKSA
jgi:hypothetical protein